MAHGECRSPTRYYNKQAAGVRPASAVQPRSVAAAGGEPLCTPRRRSVVVPPLQLQSAVGQANAPSAPSSGARPRASPRGAFTSRPASWEAQNTPAGSSNGRQPNLPARRVVPVKPPVHGNPVSAHQSAAAGASVAAQMWRAAARATSDEAKQQCKPQIVQRPNSGRRTSGPGSGVPQQRPLPAQTPRKSGAERPRSAAAAQDAPSSKPRRRPGVETGQEVKPKPSAAEQRRISDRLSKGRRKDGQELDNTRLMRRLNESASWLSNVSNIRSDIDDDEEANGILKASGDDALNQKLQQCLDARHLCLAEVLNESATWIDCDIDGCDSESDRGSRVGDEDLAAPNYPSQGHDVQPVGWRQGVARSFSC